MKQKRTTYFKHLTLIYKHRQVSLILLAFFLNLSTLNAQTFGEQNIIMQSDAKGSKSVYSADIDGDGDQDLLSASAGDDKIAWYENTDGNGNFGNQQVITTVADEACSVYATDIDGDGDQDVLSASLGDDKIAWYENTDGNGNFGTQQIITTIADGACSVFTTDIDGDGDQDVLSASNDDHKIAWYENIDGNGNFGAQQVITIAYTEARSVYATDIDGDGDQDVLASVGRAVWFENIDGNGTFSAPQEISDGGSFAVYSTDIDGDGDQDVLSAFPFYNKIAWYENTDGSGNFGTQQIITASIDNPISIYTADIDGDGDQDLLSASSDDDKITWYENKDGKGTFGPPKVITTIAHAANSVFASDIDNDGDQDVLSASYGDNKIAWYENTDGAGVFGVQQIITASVASPVKVYATDIDGDGDLDVLSAEIDKVTWYENTDGNGTFGVQQVITEFVNSVCSVYASDIDGDGDQDVLSASTLDNKVAWYENTDGNGNFGAQQVLPNSTSSARSVYASDIDGDGDQDILSNSVGATQMDISTIDWYENLDGNGTFGPQQVISNLGVGSVCTADIDNDGDQDILCNSFGDYPYYPATMYWIENTDGSGTFDLRHSIAFFDGFIYDYFPKDFDGDGDIDVLYTSKNDGENKITWSENIDENGTFEAQQLIKTCNTSLVFSTDIDGDGDQDVLSASYYDDKIAWYENIDGNGGTFGNQQVITSIADGVNSIYATDIDSDGDQDVLSSSFYDDKIAWYENLNETNVETILKNEILIYPNPTFGIINIRFANNIQEINILDIIGNLLVRKHAVQQNETVDLSVLEAGIYIISIKTDKEVFTTKIIKQ